MKWKDRLLSSSFPLEYEVGKILTSNNFYVDYDYAYKRHDDTLEKEFSIDIKAGGYYPFEINSPVKINIDMLLECKYRNPNVSWLFFSDINISEFSNFSSKGAIKVIDEFSDLFSRNSFSLFPICETCLKGVEINTQNGEVHDQGIIHGINQLVYSIPLVLERRISMSLIDHPEDVAPYVICPILVTTSELRIVNENFSIDELQKCQSLDDISYNVPYLKLYSDMNPSFDKHCSNVFKDLPEESHKDQFEFYKKLRRIRVNKKGSIDIKRMYTRPDDLLFKLQNGIGDDLFRETLICDFKHFPKLINEIKDALKLIAKGFKKIK